MNLQGQYEVVSSPPPPVAVHLADGGAHGNSPDGIAFTMSSAVSGKIGDHRTIPLHKTLSLPSMQEYIAMPAPLINLSVDDDDDDEDGGGGGGLNCLGGRGARSSSKKKAKKAPAAGPSSTKTSVSAIAEGDENESERADESQAAAVNSLTVGSPPPSQTTATAPTTSLPPAAGGGEEADYMNPAVGETIAQWQQRRQEYEARQNALRHDVMKKGDEKTCMMFRCFW